MKKTFIERRAKNASQMVRLLKLVATVTVAALTGFLHFQAAVGAQNQPARLFEIAGMNVPLEERVGKDDGASFVVHFAGDTRGSLDVCG
jgi:hypothetical protein